MSGPDFLNIAAQMIAAAAPHLIFGDSKARKLLQAEFESTIATSFLINTQFEGGEISEEEARALLESNRISLASGLSTIRGLRTLAAEQATNAAIEVLNSAVKLAFQASGKALLL